MRRRSTTDTSPWTYGTTGEKAGSTVNLTVGGQHLTTTVVSDGTWGVSAQALEQGTYQVVASITDAGGNTGTATQTLIIGDGPVEPGNRYQPDAAIRRGNGTFVGIGAYGGSAHQRLTAHLRPISKSATFTVRLTNRGDAADGLVVRGTSSSRTFRVTYLAGGTNVTALLTAGHYRTGVVAAGASVRIVVKVTLRAAARRGDRRVFELRAGSAHAPTERDVVAAVARR